MPIGRLTRKIHRHDRPVMSSRMISPPTSGPVMVAMPITAPTNPKHTGALRGWEGDLDHREHLRIHHRRHRSLEHSREVEHDGALREAAQCRRDDEPRHADDEEPLSAKDVTKPAAGDEQHRVGETVAGDDELDVGVVRLEVRADGWDRDVHDRDVEQHHEQRRHHAGKREPATRVELARRGSLSSRLRSRAGRGAASVVSVIGLPPTIAHQTHVPNPAVREFILPEFRSRGRSPGRVISLQADRSAPCGRCRPPAPRTWWRRGCAGCAGGRHASHPRGRSRRRR